MDRRYQRLTRGKRRVYMLRQLYGLTIEEWDALLASQGGCCALCGTDKPGGRGWVTDHDHASGKVRAVLCHTCNLGLGCFKDDAALMGRASDYIRRHKLTLVG